MAFDLCLPLCPLGLIVSLPERHLSPITEYKAGGIHHANNQAGNKHKQCCPPKEEAAVSNEQGKIGIFIPLSLPQKRLSDSLLFPVALPHSSVLRGFSRRSSCLSFRAPTSSASPLSSLPAFLECNNKQ